MFRLSLLLVPLACLGVAAPASAQSCIPTVEVSPDAIAASLATARAHLSARRHAQAAGIARAIAIDHASSAQAAGATELFATALTGVFDASDRRCAAEVSPAVATLRERYCASAGDAPAMCERLVQAHCHVERLRIEGLQEERRYREAYLAYVQLLRLRPFCGRADEMLFNAAINADAAELPDRALRMREILLEQFPRTPLRARTLWLIALERGRLAERARAEDPRALHQPGDAEAAAVYERFAREHENERGTSCTAQQREGGNCPDAEIALFRATMLRVRGLDPQAARADAELYRRRHGREQPDRAAQLDEVVALRFASSRR